MSKKNVRYIVGMIVVVMVSVLALGGCKKNRDKDKENVGVEGGLQVEESGEGDSSDFEDFLSLDDNTDTDNDGAPDKKDDDDNNKGTPDKEDPKHTSYEGDDKEDNTVDNEENNKDDDKEENKGENIKNDEETGWSPFF